MHYMVAATAGLVDLVWVAPFGFGFSYGAASSVAGTSSSRGGHYGYDGRRGETVEEEDDHTVQCNQM